MTKRLEKAFEEASKNKSEAPKAGFARNPRVPGSRPPARRAYAPEGSPFTVKKKER